LNDVQRNVFFCESNPTRSLMAKTAQHHGSSLTQCAISDSVAAVRLPNFKSKPLIAPAATLARNASGAGIALRWQLSMSVCNAALDAQHIALLEFAQFIEDGQLWLSEELFKNQLEDVLQLARQHCHAEEEVLEQHGFAWFEQHRADHQMGLDRLQQLMEYYMRSELEREFVCGAVGRWCASHIVDMDLDAWYSLSEKRPDA
jgi:hemerythrin-like metal-binding protein